MTTDLQQKRGQELSDWERDVEAWNLPRPISAARSPSIDRRIRSRLKRKAIASSERVERALDEVWHHVRGVNRLYRGL